MVNSNNNVNVKKIFLLFLLILLVVAPIYFYNSAQLEKELQSYCQHASTSELLESTFQIKDIQVDI